MGPKGAGAGPLSGTGGAGGIKEAVTQRPDLSVTGAAPKTQENAITRVGSKASTEQTVTLEIPATEAWFTGPLAKRGGSAAPRPGY